MRRMGVTTFLLAAVLAGGALQAARAECWELARVEPDWSLLISGKKRPVPPGIVSADLESDASPQRLRYDNPDDTSGHIGAEARWSAPPTRFCSGERVELQVRIDNLRPTRKRGNVIASASWGPSGEYGRPRNRVPDEA